jgi:hypothetical protein
VLAESEDFPHLVEALDGVVRRLGGITNEWRFDRMSTVVNPPTGHLTAAFAAVAKHYGAVVAVCPPRRGNRKGVVEKANHAAAQRWWRTLADDVTFVAAQAGVDAVAQRMDAGFAAATGSAPPLACWPMRRRCTRCRWWRSRPNWSSSGRCRRRGWSTFAATGTRYHRGWAERG